MIHYRDRLSIVKPPRDLIDTHASLSLLVKFMIEDINERLSGIVVSDNSEQVFNTDGGAESLELQQHHNTISSTVEDPGHHSNLSMDRRSSASTGVVSKHDSVLQNNTSSIRTTNSSVTVGRGRGRGVAVNVAYPGAQPTQNTGGFNNFRQGAGYWRNAPRPESTPPPAYNPTQTRMTGMNTTDRLRDELLMQLLRREHGNHDRQETGRSMKAVHNWPFKFKGEKDTTSLNTFLHRVETFARSEGLSDETLLKSVKHLLLDDALDWYGRAVAQNLLVTSEAFKNEIRKEYLPSSYTEILKLEAIFRFQAPNESFAKYYRDISALFRFVQPPMSEHEKYFIVKKNMNADYATIVTAARPRSLEEMVEVCSSYDETRMLLSRQR